MEWPDDRQEVENDPAFQEMWKELGGDKISTKEVSKKQVTVQITNQDRHHV